MITRGIRNNNPFNIKISKSRWIGKYDKSEDPVFEQFTGMFFGIRAGVLLLRRYINNYGLRSVEQIINRFCPSSDGDNRPYIDYVRDEILKDGGNPYYIVYSSDSFIRLCIAMMWFESRYTCSVHYLKKVIYGIK